MTVRVPLRTATRLAIATFSARRVVLLAASLAPPRDIPEAGGGLPLALIVPVHNEEQMLAELLAALDRLEYPAGQLSVVLVDDCSTDGSRELLRRWVDRRVGATLVEIDDRGGKAGALMRGMAAAGGAELVAFCDADVRPAPTSLREMVAAFGDEAVAGVSGLLLPRQPDVSPVARYAALETWVHQLVTSRGKDRLDLNPPVLGGLCAYRAAALRSAGGFRAGSGGEDVDATLALTRDGWRTRLAPRARAEYRVAESPAEYWRQHLRWGRAQMDSAASLRRATVPERGGPATRRSAALAWARRGEAVLASAGYLDRLAFAGAVGLALGRRLKLRWAAGYAAAAGAEVVAAVAAGGQLRALPRYLASAVALFPVDVAASAVAAATQILRRPAAEWRTGSERATGR